MIKKVIRSLISYLLLIPILVLVGIPCLLLVLLPARWRYDNKLFFWFSDLFYGLVLWIIMVPVTVVGKENLPTQPAIIVTNHQSTLDIPLIGSLMRGHPHVWLAKTELTRSWIAPVVRRMAVLIDMSTPMSGMRSLLQAINIIQEHARHAIVFPEGGRYVGDNGVREFFSGFAMLAQRTNRPVVPIMIFDAYKVYPPESFLITWHPIKVVVGKSFVFAEGETIEAFRDRVRQWFVEQAA